MLRSAAPLTIGSTSARLMTDSPVPSMSTHGEIGTAAAGSGSPASRRATSVATVSPPPAESPAIRIRAGSIPWATNQR